ncbi:MAG: hypothetical protein ACRD04_08300 [Terriglobales bacterium]
MILLGTGACDTYYIPPPPLAISLTAATSALVISSLDSNGEIIPSTVPLEGQVTNSTNTNIIYSVGQDGNYVPGGNAIYGYIDENGNYTAPLVVPNPNEVVVQAAAQVDPTNTATWTFTLENPTALVSNVTPAQVTAGQPATFNVTGINFAAGATVSMSGADITSTQLISPTEMQVAAQIEQPGMLGLSVVNPFPFGPPNSFLVRSLPTSPATSSAIAVTVASAGSDANANLTLLGAQPATAAATSVGVKLPAQVSSGVLSVTGSGITGSPLGCQVQLESVQAGGTAAPSETALFAFTPADTYQAMSVPAAGTIVAVFTCTVYPTAGSITVAFNSLPITEAYVPQPDSLAVVDLDSSQQIASVLMPSGYQPSMAAADPAENQVIVASTDSNILEIVNSNLNTVTGSFTVPVSSSTTVNGLSCKVCALMVDSARHEAILDTAAGYFTLNLDNGITSTPIAAPASANFSYDPLTQRIFVPYASSGGSGVQLIDLHPVSVSEAEPLGSLFGSATGTATWDATSGVLSAGDTVSGAYLALNLNNAKTANGTSQAPAAPFSITAGCAQPWHGMDVDLVGHLGWLANLGNCIAVAGLSQAAVNGTPAAPSPIRWAFVPNAPNGVSWQNSQLAQPPTLAAYTGSDGRAYGLELSSDGTMLLNVDLGLLQSAAAVSGGVDTNEVNPAQATRNGQTVSALTFIPLH